MISDGNDPPGRELATFIADALRRQGFDVIGPDDREGWAWDMTCRLPNVRIDCIIGAVDDRPRQWLVTTAPRVSLVDRLRGRKHLNVQTGFYESLDQILKTDGRFHAIRWYFQADFDRDYGESWAEGPTTESTNHVKGRESRLR